MSELADHLLHAPVVTRHQPWPRVELDSAGLRERLNELEGEVQDLRHQLTEAQERLDFAERLLAKPKDRAAT